MPSVPESTETREKIIEIARELFALKGYASVSTRQIARALSMSNTAIYLHFRTKRSLLDAILSLFHQSWIESFPEDLGRKSVSFPVIRFMDELVDRIRRLMEDPVGADGWSILAAMQFHDSECRKMLKQGMESSFSRILSEYFATRSGNQPGDPEGISAFITGNLFHLIEDLLSSKIQGVPLAGVWMSLGGISSKIPELVGLKK